LPLASKVKVTNLENGRSIEVTVNDRGPYVAGRVLDLSTRAAQVLGMQKEGLALVRIEVLQPQQLASAARE
jgi:rare lipoprotein A